MAETTCYDDAVEVTVTGEEIDVCVGQEGPSGPAGPAGDVDISGKADKVGTVDIEITNPAKGIILRTADGTRGRITIIKDEYGDLVLKVTAL